MQLKATCSEVGCSSLSAAKKLCSRHYQRQRYKENPERFKSASRKWAAQNKETVSRMRRAYSKKNKEKLKKYYLAYYQVHRENFILKAKRWKESNPDLVRGYRQKGAQTPAFKEARRRYRKTYKGKLTNKVYKAARRSQERKRHKPSPEHRAEIRKMYAQCPVGYHVDHVIPLRGSNVSGLHVPWNLQYLPALENIRKSNKFAA